jgi:hypothetical protein
MNEKDFKLTLSKTLERNYIKDKSKYNEDFIDVYTTLPDCGIYIEYTGIFTRTEWNTYRAILHLQVPLSRLDVFEKYHSIILTEATQLFGRQDDYYLTDLNIDVLVEKHKTFDFQELGLNETLRMAVSDATTLMAQGKYSSCIDRVHTALHGYLRVRLDELGNDEYSEDDSIMRLFNLLYREWEEVEDNNINKMMLKVLRSASASLEALNNIRNDYSLAHPNNCIIGEPEAIFILGIMESIVNYMETRAIKGGGNFEC